jgi:hypothetical protein
MNKHAAGKKCLESSMSAAAAAVLICVRAAWAACELLICVRAPPLNIW